MASNERNLDSLSESPNARIRRWIFASLMVPVVVFLVLSAYSYDWQDIQWLCNPVNTPIANILGLLGAWSTFYGLITLGVAFLVLPIWALVLTIRLMTTPRMHYLYGAVASVNFFVVAAAVAQLHSPFFDTLIAMLNIAPNGGGFVGYFVTEFLAHWLNPSGAAILLWPYLIFSLIWLIGFKRTLNALTLLLHARVSQSDEVTGEVLDKEAIMREAYLKKTGQVPEAPKQHWWHALGKLFVRTNSPAEEKVIDEDEPFELVADEVPPEARVEPESKPHTPTILDVFKERLGDEPGKETPATAPQAAAPRADDVPTKRVRGRLTDPTPDVGHVKRDDSFTLDSPLLADKLQPLSHASITDPAPLTKEEPVVEIPKYKLPTPALLDPLPDMQADAGNTQEVAETIVKVLTQFGTPVELVNIVSGPVVTQYELLPDENVKIERISGFAQTLKMRLSAHTLRILAPIPGKPYVGIEVPNHTSRPVVLREILESKTWKHAVKKMALPMALGKDSIGGDLVADLAKLPHLLVAGATGAGKSVGLNAILSGFLMSRTPDQLRLILVDPKEVEFTAYEDLPHLLVPVVTDPKRVVFALRWAVVEMGKRYKTFKRNRVRNITDYNEMREQQGDKTMPYVVIIIDELADLMQQVKSDIEPQIMRITQLARAAGIHMIIATQRPVVDVITGTIKSNIPGRLAFKVSQANDSRTILDEKGAEELIGRGDMLFRREGSNTVRSQGCWVSDEEIKTLCDHIKEQVGPAYDEAFEMRISAIQVDEEDNSLDAAMHDLVPATSTPQPAATPTLDDDTSDEGYYRKALELIRNTGRFSTSALQRTHRVGYNKAARITDLLEERGIIGPNNGKGIRDLLVDPTSIVLPGEEKDDAMPLEGLDEINSETSPMDDEQAMAQVLSDEDGATDLDELQKAFDEDGL